MRKLYIFIFIIGFLVSCREDLVEFPDTANAGTIFVDSSPRGADILLDGATTFKVTPDSLNNLVPGVYLITLRLNSYTDTTVIVNLKSGTKPFLDVRLRQR